MRSILEFFIDRSLVVNSIMVGVIVVGAATLVSMDRALIPRIDVKTIQVQGTLPGASAVDTERYLTFPIEESIKDLAGLEKLSSTTEAGQFEILLAFAPDHDGIDDSLETVRARIDELRPRLPEDLQPLVIRQRKQDRVEFIKLALTPIEFNNREHRTWAKSFAEKLDLLPHVVSVGSSLPEHNLFIEFERDAVDEAGIDVRRVEAQIRQLLRYQPIGTVHSDYHRISIELEGGFHGIEALEKMPVTRNRVGRGLNLSDVAKVRLRSSNRFERTVLDGKPYVTLKVFKDAGSDVISLDARVVKMVETFNAEAPGGMQARILGQAAPFIEKPLATVFVNGLAGLLIVAFVLFLFLGFRVAAMAVIGLPFVYFGTFIVLDAMGIQIHLVSVIGMLLVLGLLVDDAILVAERFLDRLGTGLSPKEAALDASGDLLRPVTGTVLTNIVVFAPILLIESEIADVLFAIPVVVISTLALSLFESFFLLPNHLVHFVPAGYQFKERRIFVKARRIYEIVLQRALRWRYVAVLGFIGCFAGGIFLFVQMDKDFSLQLGTRSVFVRAVVSESDSLESTLEQGLALEKRARQLPPELGPDAIEFIERTAGRALAPGGHQRTGQRELELRIVVDNESEDNEVLAGQVQAHLSKSLVNVPGFELIEVHERKGGSEKDDDIVTIYVSGGDSLSFEQIQDEIRNRIANIQGLEVLMDPNRFQIAWKFIPDAEQLSAYEIETETLAQILRQNFAPQELTRLRHLGDEITVFTQYRHDADYMFDELAKLTLVSPRGIAIELSRLGRWERLEVLSKIEHLDLLREFEVDVRYDKKELNHDAVKDKLEAELEPLRLAHPQYAISVRPPERAEAAKKWIAKVVIACLVVIFFTLVLILGSLVQPLLVMFSIPFGFTGVALAFWAHDLPMGLMAMIGLVGLTGVVVNDSLVMVDTINGVRRTSAGNDILQATVQGASTRFKAVVLTSITTLGGVFPMAYGIGGDTGWTRPLAFSLGWGLLFATALTLFLLPCTLLIFEDVNRLGRKLVRKR